MFNYGSFKLLLLKVFLGVFLFSFSLFLFVSLYTYNPNDPGIGRLVGKSEIINFFGFWGAFFSSVLITLYGKASFFLVIFLSYLGVFMFLGLTLKKPLLKILLIILSVTLFNIVLLLQQTFDVSAGLLSKIIFDIYESSFPFLIDNFLYRSLGIVSCHLRYLLFYFLYCFSINISFLKNIILKIFSFNFF
jgi:S-DNA-T family DNA segregation ATPase FtsK/SpoIIIE